MLDRVMTAAFEDVQKTAQIAVEVGPGIVQRVTHPGLGREVDHYFGLFTGKQVFNGRGIGQVNRCELEMADLLLHPTHAIVLELRVVVVVEIIQADHLMPVAQQPQHTMGTNESGGSGHENLHGRGASGTT
ncbi:hypothetical protein D3C81_744860 [compost metagenome]